MQYKQVSVAGDLTVPVPLGLTAEEEAKYIANRVAFVDLEQLKTDSIEILKAWEEGKLIPMGAVLSELKKPGDNEWPVMADNSTPLYTVAHLPSVADEIKQEAERAAALGKKTAFLASLEAVYKRLCQDPREFGEYRFSWQTLEWFIVAIRPVSVQNAVHRNQPVVFVIKVTLMD